MPNSKSIKSFFNTAHMDELTGFKLPFWRVKTGTPPDVVRQNK